MKKYDSFISSLKFNEQGLIPAVIQDYRTNKVLMVAWMNRESLDKTLSGGKCCYWSRSRQKLWLKGETSGNVQLVKEIFTDCDRDCLLVKADQIGNASCHDGYNSCFYRKLSKNGALKISGKRIFNPEKVYKK